jgi:hypothetical protein
VKEIGNGDFPFFLLFIEILFMNELFWGGFSMVLKPVQSAVFLLVLNC